MRLIKTGARRRNPVVTIQEPQAACRLRLEDRFMSALFPASKLKTSSCAIASPLSYTVPVQRHRRCGGDWHAIRYASLACRGEPAHCRSHRRRAGRRITPACLGCGTTNRPPGWRDRRLDRGRRRSARHPDRPLGARPAQSSREGDDHIAAGDPRGWATISTSAVAWRQISSRKSRRR